MTPDFSPSHLLPFTERKALVFAEPPALVRCPGCGRGTPFPATGGGPEQGAARTLSCSRCQCELGPLIVIRQAADSLVRQALDTLCAGCHAQALDLAELAWNLNRHPQAASCGLLASVLLRDPDRIRAWSRRQ